ncbi:transposon Tf2-6 polyprotein [Trichonephila clavipes]|nr:transposon Tf2-6 polyprotein [Trichonephila clavipes]
MDDVIISSPSFTQHVEHLKEVFRLLHEAGLTLNKEKCKFGCEELKYLGLIINKEGIKTDETKVQAIVEMKPPHNSKEVSKFLGMSQWYAKFIKNYADICEPLYNLKRKLKRFIYIWSIEAQTAFDAVKAAITKAPVLKFPDFKKPFELFTDASSIGVGAVLNQEQRPVVFAFRTLSAAERNYTVTERECLAVVWALNKFRTYLGSLPIKVITHHAALTHLTTGKNLSNRMIRWALKLAEFSIEWEHRSGTQNTIADVLSRNSIESIIGEKVNCAIIRDLVLSSRDQLIEEQKTDPELGHIYRYLENPEDSSVTAAICENWSRDCRLVEGLLFYAKYATSLGEMRVYIPKFLRNEIMREFHDNTLAGHFGRFKTYHKIRDVCYFPYMRKFIDQYVSTCHMFQINNYKNALPAGRLIPIVSNYPNEIVTLDLLGPYPVSRVRRNRYVLVITDHFSKWAEIIPLKKASARVIADNFFNNYISRFGAPIKLISDNGPQFISDIFENLSERLGIRHVKTVDYRPQVRLYRHRKCDETEIVTGNSDNGSLHDESSGFDRGQRRSNESQDGKKKGSDVKRESSGPERKIRKFRESSDYRVPKRALSSNNSNVLQKYSRKRPKQDKVAVSTNRYDLRHRGGREVESQPAMEMKTQKGGPGRSRKGRARKDNTYIDERTRSSCAEILTTRGRWCAHICIKIEKIVRVCVCNLYRRT